VFKPKTFNKSLVNQTSTLEETDHAKQISSSENSSPKAGRKSFVLSYQTIQFRSMNRIPIKKIKNKEKVILRNGNYKNIGGGFTNRKL
jgi:hypothetical protein